MSRILIADDDEGIRASLARVLEQGGHEALVAASGDEALGLLRGGCPDLFLLDLRMPGLPGLETLERARAACPEIPVILMTAYGSTEAVIEAMKLGAFDYVAKPLDPPDLLARVEKALVGAKKDLAGAEGTLKKFANDNASIVGLEAPLFTLKSPGIVSIPLGFLAVFLFSFLYRDERAASMWEELYVRSNTGLGRAAAAAH